MHCRLLFVSVVSTLSALSAEPRRLLIDADTANEVDDAYAIVRAIIEPSFEVVGLNSTQWQISHYATPETLMDSQRMNEALLSYLGRMDIPHPLGAYRRLHDWGSDTAQHSGAAYHIIREAHATAENEKLTVAVLGAHTNLASALLIDPTIAPKLNVYMLGTKYDFEREIWTKRDFNCVMDIQAIEVVLNQLDLELHIIPVNVASAMTFGQAEMIQQLSDRHPVTSYLHQIWMGHSDASRLQRTIWDLAVISCLISPSFGEEITVAAPPENGGHLVSVFRSVDGEGIRAEFYRAINQAFPR